MRIMSISRNMYMNSNISAPSFKGVFKCVGREYWANPGRTEEFTSLKYEYYPFKDETQEDIQKAIHAHQKEHEISECDGHVFSTRVCCYYNIKPAIDRDTYVPLKRP